jgi:uncharacterized membrane protein YoaK (UPF0700 family)
MGIELGLNVEKERPRMVHVELENLYKKEYALLWAILSFKAGLINAAGFLITGSYVSHVTGFGTQIGLAWGHEDYTIGLELLVIPIAFIGGAIITSLVLDRNYSKDKVPNYPIVQLLITALIGLISICFMIGFFQIDTLAGKSENSIFLIGLLCLVCGLKNGLTTWASHGKIRTTHITGLSTDIGLHLKKIFQPEGSNSRYPEPRKVTYVRISTLVSFSIGSSISALLIPTINYKIFYISFLISVLLSSISIIHRRKTISKTNPIKTGEIYANIN